MSREINIIGHGVFNSDNRQIFCPLDSGDRMCSDVCAWFRIDKGVDEPDYCLCGNKEIGQLTN